MSRAIRCPKGALCDCFDQETKFTSEVRCTNPLKDVLANGASQAHRPERSADVGRILLTTLVSKSHWPIVLLEAVGGWKLASAPRRRMTKTWLILPVVICLSQRLSHACLGISFYIAKLRMAHYNSNNLFDDHSYMDNCGNSRANTCIPTQLLGRVMFIRYRTNAGSA